MGRVKGSESSGTRVADGTAGTASGSTVGQLTSGIKNKIARSEAYHRLKKAKKVRLITSVHFRSTICPFTLARSAKAPSECTCRSAPVTLSRAQHAMFHHHTAHKLCGSSESSEESTRETETGPEQS